MHGKNYLAANTPGSPNAARWAARRSPSRTRSWSPPNHMLDRDEPYRDLGADWHARRNDEAHTRRLVAQFERLGHTVVIDPAA